MNQVVLQGSHGERWLSAAEFQHLTAVPATVEWFTNIDNPHPTCLPKRSGRHLQLIGLTAAEEFHAVTRVHVPSCKRSGNTSRGPSPSVTVFTV
ncbi:hypothetical protein [Pseudomonas syringae]|uniref:hypothetical protein n=1 Tax=Pseudomonas syringae TaxID=317 RepID=UPI0039AF968E